MEILKGANTFPSFVRQPFKYLKSFAKLFPQSFFLKTNHDWFFQSFSLGLCFQSLDHSCYHPWNLFTSF